jgi:hypothetical protein
MVTSITVDGLSKVSRRGSSYGEYDPPVPGEETPHQDAMLHD